MTADLTRPRSPFPYDFLPTVPTFTLTSPDMRAGEDMGERFTGLADNISPALQWSGAPEDTRSFAVTCFDPDAPGPAGFWHWGIVDLDATVTSLPQGIGESDLQLDGAAFHLRNDSGTHSWCGPYPPAGDGPHRYIFAVHALDVDTLDVADDTPLSAVACQLSRHTLARALLTVTYAVADPQRATPFLQGDL